MRRIASFQDQNRAKRFSDFLYVQRIPNTLEQEEQSWDLWIHRDEQIPLAQQFLQAYMKNPDAPDFTQAKTEAQTQRRREFFQDRRSRHRYVNVRSQWRFGQGSIGSVTMVLIIISAVVYLAKLASGNGEILNALGISKLSTFYDYKTWDPRPYMMGIDRLLSPERLSRLSLYWTPADLSEIRHGQIWRLVTPIFIHFSFLHILFNMMWLMDLGSMIERKLSSNYLLFFVLVIGILSNVAQFIVSGPTFGGMSGVVYGLLGFVWIRGKFDPSSGLFLHKTVVYWMIGWFVLCLTGLMGSIGNMAHGVGLLGGMIWGYLSSFNWIRKFRIN